MQDWAWTSTVWSEFSLFCRNLWALRNQIYEQHSLIFRRCQGLSFVFAVKAYSFSHSTTHLIIILFTGLSDVPGEAMVKLYCPKCQDVYTPKSSRHHHTDGAYFGTGFPHMLFMVHPEYRPKRPANQFVPRLVTPIYKLVLLQPNSFTAFLRYIFLPIQSQKSRSIL